MKTLTLMTDENPKFDRDSDVCGTLDKVLNILGVKYERVLGKYDGKYENSFCIEDLSRSQAMALAKSYGQESLCFMEGSWSMGNSWKLIYVNGDYEGRYLNQSGRVVWSDVEPDDNFTKFGSFGDSEHLQINFNWGHFRKFHNR